MEENDRHIVIGTAGHIDHGKTSMVIHLTGKDTDWLKEEKERGMTIDLGFAFIGDRITVIDVPGHEKFVRNMVAGVSTIDFVLFVIAADDGVMPQTREHLEILNLLQIQTGIIVITKIDLAEPDWTGLVIDDVKQLVRGTFLENAPIMKISNKNGTGIDELKSEIAKNITKVKARKDKGVFRLPIDRVFTMKGYGTVVAGTVLSGSLTQEKTVQLLPQGTIHRIRGLQKHEKKVDQVRIGDRAAINLVGIEKEAISRGDVLAEPGFFKPTRFFDAKLYLLSSFTRKLKNTSRVRIHVGTSEVIGRISLIDKNEIEPGASCYVQFRLEKPIVADIEDRFIVRSYSPLFTIGGGRILAINPKRHKRFTSSIIEKFKTLDEGEPRTIIEQFLLEKKFVPQSHFDITAATNLSEKIIHSNLKILKDEKIIYQFEDKNNVFYLHNQYYKQAKELLLQALENFHKDNPTKRGVNKSEFKTIMKIPLEQNLIMELLNELAREKKVVLLDSKLTLSSHIPQISPKQKNSMDKILTILMNTRFATPNTSEIATQLDISMPDIDEAVDILLDTGQIIKVDGIFLFHRACIEEAIGIIKEFFIKNKELTVSDCKQLFQNSRKYNVPLLNYFDRLGLTIRQHDVRILNPDFHN